MSSHVERFEIMLEHDIDEQYQYEPGELLRGAVVLVLKEPTKVKVLQAHIQGEATVSLENDEGKNSGAVSSNQTLINVTHNIIAAPAGIGNLITLERGEHRYPLEYALPSNLPSSFIGKYGSVTYVVKATLKEDKRFGLNTVITSEPFLVLRHYDITNEHKLLMACEKTASKRYHGGLVFCLSGKISAVFRINKTGFIPGEDILMDATITNTSPRRVNAIEACLVMVSKFTAKTETITNTQTVNRKRDEWEFSGDEGRRWNGVRLTIPPYIPESRLDGCDIITIDYQVNFRLDVSGNSVIQLNVPITMGTSSTVDPRERRASGKSTQKWFMDGTSEELDENFNTSNGAIDESGVDMDMYSEETLQFRRPMEFGETRQNPLLEFDEDASSLNKERL